MSTGVGNEERQLMPQWSPELVALSYCISWLGAYTSTQIIIHAKYTRSTPIKWLWTFLASVAFGFSAIWSMHFVGMIACRLDVTITFDVSLTILSAFVAVFFTFVALSSAYVSESIENSKFALALSRRTRALRTHILSFFDVHRIFHQSDIEAGGYLPISSTSDADVYIAEGHDILSPVNEEDEEHEEDENEASGEYFRDRSRTPSFTGQERGANPFVDRYNMPANEPTPLETSGSPRVNKPPTSSLTYPQLSSLPRAKIHQPHLGSGSGPRPVVSTNIHSANEDSTLDSLSADGSSSAHISDRSSFDSNLPSHDTSTSTNTWSESLHTGLSREARLRIKAQSRDKPMPKFGWRYWLKGHYKIISVLVFIRTTIWALAVVFMHYCGMWAMEIPQGRISWDLRIVVLSYVVAFVVCFIGCIAMVQMEVHFGRQVAFSTITAAGCCSMHYTGMAAATFYTRARSDPNAGYPAYLPFAIVGIAVFVCVISNTVLAQSAINSRNRMAEMILTKRRLWRIMAEKEAAEQANELKQQFISVASHEIRTPLHAVNGYCELLALTDLTEEQALYVTSIQQACHAINVIAGNVLDFSKLDRNNVELSARPVLVDLRKMVENLARITDTRGAQPGQQGADVIVSVANDVPPAVYLDETYTFRIMMNLLSNAQKFCDTGYICVSVTMDSQEIVNIKVSDTGCGIPKSFRSALFQPFRQADTSLTKARQGTGLGLSIVKHLLQRMNGTVDVDSVEGEGSTFTIKLPVASPSPPPPPPNTKPLHPHKRIKIIYHHDKTARLFTELWSQFGCMCTLASPHTSLSDLVKDTDAVWTDAQSVESSQALRELMSSKNWKSLPPLYIVHSDAVELSSLEPSLSSARGVILTKRPVIIHNLLGILETPESFMGAHLSSEPAKVRFTLPEDASLDKEKLREGKGSVSPPPSESSQMFSPFSNGVTRNKGKVLLVEDNKVNQHLGRRLLEKLGYDVETASDGQEAIDKILTVKFSGCLMDCQMPVLDGFAATSKVREMENNGTIHGRLPIIALTANVSNDNEDRCRAAGMDHFLAKPLKLTDLQTTLSQFEENPP